MDNVRNARDDDAFTAKSRGFSIIYICPLIHERQKLQLCALHAINNLLQLDQGLDLGVPKSSGIIPKPVLLCGGRIYEMKKSIPYVTKAEFDSVADELTVREEEFRNGIETTMPEDGERKTSLSLWKKICSHHRTPFTGNYSLEVLQETLSRRNVLLQWYQQNAIPMELFGDDYNDSDKKERKVLLGFIINSMEPFSFSKPSSYIGGRHWYVITRVRRVLGMVKPEYGDGEGNNNADMDVDTTAAQIVHSETNQPISYDRSMWHLINSSSEEDWDMTPAEVIEFIENVRNTNGSILQATLMRDR